MVQISVFPSEILSQNLKSTGVTFAWIPVIFKKLLESGIIVAKAVFISSPVIAKKCEELIVIELTFALAFIPVISILLPLAIETLPEVIFIPWPIISIELAVPVTTLPTLEVKSKSKISLLEKSKNLEGYYFNKQENSYNYRLVFTNKLDLDSIKVDLEKNADIEFIDIKYAL